MLAAAAASIGRGIIMKREIERRHMARNGRVRSAFIVGALVGTIALSSAARADQTQFILDFNLPDVPLLPFFRYQSFDSYLFVQGAGGQTPFVNWIALGAPEFNADGLSADLAQTAAGVITICRGGGCPGGSPVFTFDFTSIGLASATNDRTGGQVAFVFDHPDGTFDTSIVTLKPGTSGLQTFSFNEQNLLDVKFFGVDGKLLQFDNLGLSQLAPDSVPLALLSLAPSPARACRACLACSGLAFSPGGDGGRKSPEQSGAVFNSRALTGRSRRLSLG
jgi:hypothetical protein